MHGPTPDHHVNLAISTVVTPPSPPSSGTSLGVTPGEGARFETPYSYNATVWPTGEIPTQDNAEIVRITAVSIDTLVIEREQEDSLPRAIVVGDLIAATITKKSFTDIEQQTDTYGPWYLRGPRPYIDPMHNYYGAVGDGSVDDTDALQNALDDAYDTVNGSGSSSGARVELPGGTYRITSPLHVRATGSPYQRGISLLGSGPLICTILSEVPADFAIRHEGQKYAALGGFKLANGTGSRGTTGGVLFTGAVDNPGSGSQNSGHLISQLSVDGYSMGIQCGEGDFRASELTFVNLVLTDNDIGFNGFGQNSLNFNFQQLVMFSNTYGLKSNMAGSILVLGGASNGNDYDFFFEELANVCINQFRSESWNNRVIWANPPGIAPLNLTVIGLRALDATSTSDGGCLELRGGTQASLQECYLQGKVFVNRCTVKMNDCSVNDTQLIRPLAVGDLDGVNFNSSGCTLINPSFVSFYSDTYVGVTWNSSDVEVGGIRVTAAGAVNVIGPLTTPSLKMTTAPSAGYVLTSDADGDASWQAVGAASVSFEDMARWWVD